MNQDDSIPVYSSNYCEVCGKFFLREENSSSRYCGGCTKGLTIAASSQPLPVSGLGSVPRARQKPQ